MLVEQPTSNLDSVSRLPLSRDLASDLDSSSVVELSMETAASSLLPKGDKSLLKELEALLVHMLLLLMVMLSELCQHKPCLPLQSNSTVHLICAGGP